MFTGRPTMEFQVCLKIIAEGDGLAEKGRLQSEQCAKDELFSPNQKRPTLQGKRSTTEFC